MGSKILYCMELGIWSLGGIGIAHSFYRTDVRVSRETSPPTIDSLIGNICNMYVSRETYYPLLLANSENAVEFCNRKRLLKPLQK